MHIFGIRKITFYITLLFCVCVWGGYLLQGLQVAQDSVKLSLDSKNSTESKEFKSKDSIDSKKSKDEDSTKSTESNKDSKNLENLNTTKPIDYAFYRGLYAKDISEWEKPNVDDGIEFEEMQPLPSIAPLKPNETKANETKPNETKSNETKSSKTKANETKPNETKLSQNNNTFSEEKAVLGKILFHERMLSKSQQIACASCHNSELALGDGISTSFGHNRQKGRRNSPNIAMSGFFDTLFWDGRAASLEEQALFPISDPLEMANSLDSAIATLQNMPQYYALFILAFGDFAHKAQSKKYYPDLFENTESKDAKLSKNLTLSRNPNVDSMPFLSPKEPLPKEYVKYAKSLINTQNLSYAIATFERTLVPQNTRFNAFLQGRYNALSDKEIYGLHIFRTKGRCMNCHYGVALSDSKFHNIGLSFYGRKLQDLGRYEISGEASDVGAFKTPSLIQVSKSAPYMHNGIFPHLRGVLNMYNAGFPSAMPKEISNIDSRFENPPLPVTTPLIKPLNLNREEIEALEAFLGSL